MTQVKYASNITEGAELLLTFCGNLKAGEKISIVCDSTTREVGEILKSEAMKITSNVSLVEVPPLAMHGEEPTPEAANAMKESDLCLGVTAKSLAHSKARIEACNNGARYLSLPDYSLDLLGDSSLRADYRKRAVIAKKVADAFTNGTLVHVTSQAGTDMTMSAEGRIGNCCPGYVEKAGDLGSPPDIESNVSPVEDSAEGVVVVDGSIPYPTIGLLKSPITLKVKAGKIVEMLGDKDVLEKLKALFDAAGSDKAKVLAECGVGLNDKATLTGVMLTDEGTAGTMHFGFGSNATVGGKNEVSFHLDFVFKNPTCSVDGHVLLKEGEFIDG